MTKSLAQKFYTKGIVHSELLTSLLIEALGAFSDPRKRSGVKEIPVSWKLIEAECCS